MEDGQSSGASKAVPWQNDEYAQAPCDYGDGADVDLSEYRNTEHPSTRDLNTSDFSSLFVDSRFSSSILRDEPLDSHRQVDTENVRGQASGMSAGSVQEQFSSDVFEPNKRSDSSYPEHSCEVIPEFCRLKIFDPVPSTPSEVKQVSMNRTSNLDGPVRSSPPVHRDLATPQSSQHQPSRRNRSNQRMICSVDLDDKKMKRVKNNLSTFIEKMEPGELLLHLKKCLTDEQYEHIRCQMRVGEPAQAVNRLLWQYLKRAPHWWQHLEQGLQECGCYCLLELMQNDKKQENKLSFK